MGNILPLLNQMKAIILLSMLFLFGFFNAYNQCPDTLVAVKDAQTFSLSCNASYAVSTGNCDTTNAGDADNADVFSWTFSGDPAYSRAFFEFDLNTISGCSVSNAVLILSHDQNSGARNCGTQSTWHSCISNAFRVSRVTQSWNEMTIAWLNEPPVAGSLSGQDYTTVADDSASMPTYQINITEIVNFWLANSGSNFGIRIGLETESIYNRVRFATREHSNNVLHPKLVLTYNPSLTEEMNKKMISVDIYPNPFMYSSTVRIANYSEFTNKKVELKMYDVLGQVVRTLPVSRSTFSVSGDGLASGLYAYKLYAEKNLVGTGKILIQK